MTTVLEEVTDARIDRIHVRRRIDDWLERIDALFDLIASWLPEGAEAIRQPAARHMREPLMVTYDLEAVALPALDIRRAGHPRAMLTPVSLWIVGANGRLDLRVGSRLYIIVDAAEIYQPSRWLIMESLDRMNRRTLDDERFLATLE